MARLMRTALIVLAVLGFSPDVQAVPSFTWEGPWNVTLLGPLGPNFAGPAIRAFGAPATQDGQILDTTADTAVAKSEQNAFRPIGGSIGLTFSRQFVLSGAEQGWVVSLNGVLKGGLAARAGSASVSAMASVTPSLSIAFQQTLISPDEFSPSQVGLDQSLSQTAILTDGLYAVTGSLTTTAVSARDAFSGFFGRGSDDPRGFQVSVTASAIPEPSTLLLLASGLAGAAWAYRKRAV